MSEERKLIPELVDVLSLIERLPEDWQRMAAHALGEVLERYDRRDITREQIHEEIRSRNVDDPEQKEALRRIFRRRYFGEK